MSGPLDSPSFFSQLNKVLCQPVIRQCCGEGTLASRVQGRRRPRGWGGGRGAALMACLARQSANACAAARPHAQPCGPLCSPEGVLGSLQERPRASGCPVVCAAVEHWFATGHKVPPPPTLVLPPPRLQSPVTWPKKHRKHRRKKFLQVTLELGLGGGVTWITRTLRGGGLQGGRRIHMQRNCDGALHKTCHCVICRPQPPTQRSNSVRLRAGPIQRWMHLTERLWKPHGAVKLMAHMITIYLKALMNGQKCAQICFEDLHGVACLQHPKHRERGGVPSDKVAPVEFLV